jgi:LPXTG-motif cell wall-anchored protein
MLSHSRPRRLASLMLLVLGLPLLFAGILTGAGTATAAVIPSAITSISTTTTTVGQGDKVDFTCEWAVPDNSQAGDTFNMQLPAQLQWWGSANFDLTNPNGDVVATAVADATGLVTFTLTDFVSTHPLNVNGNCAFTTKYVAAQTAPGQETLTFPVGATVISVPITDNGPCVTNCTVAPPTEAAKYMWWTDATQSQLQSQIIAPITTGEINSVTITDDPEAGLALDCSTKYVVVGKTLAGDGSIATPNDTALYPPSTFDCTAAGLTVTWDNLPAGEYVQMYVQATPTNTTQNSYTNNGLVTMNGQDQPVGTQHDRTTASGSGDGTAATTPTTTPPVETVPATTAPAETTTPATTTPETTTPAIETVPATTAPVETTAPTTTAPAETTTPPSPSESASSTSTTAATTPATPSAVASSTTSTTATPSTQGTVSPAGTATPESNQLAYTGANGNPLIIGAGILLLAGAAALVLGRGRVRVRQH